MNNKNPLLASARRRCAPNLRFSRYRFARPTGGAGNVEDESKYVKTPESYTGVENYGWSVEWKKGRDEGGRRVGWGGGLPLLPGGQSCALAFPVRRSLGMPPPNFPLLASFLLQGCLAGAERHRRDVGLAHERRQQGPRGLDRRAHHRPDGAQPLRAARQRRRCPGSATFKSRHPLPNDTAPKQAQEG